MCCDLMPINLADCGGFSGTVVVPWQTPTAVSPAFQLLTLWDGLTSPRSPGALGR